MLQTEQLERLVLWEQSSDLQRLAAHSPAEVAAKKLMRSAPYCLIRLNQQAALSFKLSILLNVIWKLGLSNKLVEVQSSKNSFEHAFDLCFAILPAMFPDHAVMRW